MPGGDLLLRHCADRHEARSGFIHDFDDLVEGVERPGVLLGEIGTDNRDLLDMVALVHFRGLADELGRAGEPLSEDEPGHLARDLELTRIDDVRAVSLVEMAGGAVAHMDPLHALERERDLGKGQGSHLLISFRLMTNTIIA